MTNFDYITKENIKDHNRNWPQIPDHPCKLIITGGYGYEKTKSFLS